MIIGKIRFGFSKPLVQIKNNQPIYNKSSNSNTFIKSDNKTTFQGVDRNISSGEETPFLENGSQKDYKTEGEVFLYDYKVDNLEARNARLRGNSHVKNAKGIYITLFDNSSADEIKAELSASLHSEGRVKNVIASSVDAQANEGAFISNIKADHVTVGMQINVDTIHANEADIINETFVDEVYAKKAEVSGNAQVRMIVADDVRVRNDAFVETLYANEHAGISGNAHVKDVIIGEDNATVSLRDNPTFDSIDFIKGNGTLKLYKMCGKYPQIDESKIKGAKIEYSKEKTAVNGFTYGDINHFVEYKQNF